MMGQHTPAATLAQAIAQLLAVEGGNARDTALRLAHLLVRALEGPPKPQSRSRMRWRRRST